MIKNLDSNEKNRIFAHENWKEIKDYPNYEVSDMGRIKSKRRPTKERILKTYMNKNGYSIVGLLDAEGNQHNVQVHRLVADAFCPNPDKKPFVDHINCEKEDNRAVNLRWVTAKENSNNPITLERTRKGRLISAKAQEQMVYVYNEKIQLVTAYTSTSAAHKKDGWSQGNVVRCCSGELKRYKGLIFSYVPLFSMDDRISQEEKDEAVERRKKVLDQNKRNMKKWLKDPENRKKYNERARMRYGKGSVIQ